MPEALRVALSTHVHFAEDSAFWDDMPMLMSDSEEEGFHPGTIITILMLKPSSD
jgi:hypothetical protein